MFKSVIKLKIILKKQCFIDFPYVTKDILPRKLTLVE